MSEDKNRKSRDAFLKQKVVSSKLFQSQHALSEAEQRLQEEKMSKEQLLDAHHSLLEEYNAISSRVRELERAEREKDLEIERLRSGNSKKNSSEEDEEEEEEEEKKKEEKRQEKKKEEDGSVDGDFHHVTIEEVRDAEYVHELEQQLKKAKEEIESYLKALKASERHTKTLEEKTQAAEKQVEELSQQIAKSKQERQERQLLMSKSNSVISEQDQTALTADIEDEKARIAIKALEDKHRHAQHNLRLLKGELEFAKKIAAEEMARVAKLQEENDNLKHRIESFSSSASATAQSAPTAALPTSYAFSITASPRQQQPTTVLLSPRRSISTLPSAAPVSKASYIISSKPISTTYYVPPAPSNLSTATTTTTTMVNAPIYYYPSYYQPQPPQPQSVQPIVFSDYYYYNNATNQFVQARSLAQSGFVRRI